MNEAGCWWSRSWVRHLRLRTRQAWCVMLWRISRFNSAPQRRYQGQLRSFPLSPSSSQRKSAEYRICHFQICAKIKSCCGQTLDLHTYHIKLARLIRDVFSFDIYHTFRPKFPAQASLIGEERMGDTTMPRCLVELETNIREVWSFRNTEPSLDWKHLLALSHWRHYQLLRHNAKLLLTHG